MSFTDQKQRVATKTDVMGKWGGAPKGKRFRCYLCGHKFEVGDKWRWVYSITVYSNFLVCEKCDGEDVHEKWRKHIADLRTKYWFATNVL